MTDSQRNLLILVVIAVIAAVASGTTGKVETGTGDLAGLLQTIITLLFVAAIVILYRRNAGTIAQLATTPRLVLQVASLAGGAILLTGTVRLGTHLPYPPFGWASHSPVAFYGGLFACGFAIWWAWQQRVTRW